MRLKTRIARSFEGLTEGTEQVAELCVERSVGGHEFKRHHDYFYAFDQLVDSPVHLAFVNQLRHIIIPEVSSTEIEIIKRVIRETGFLKFRIIADRIRNERVWNAGEFDRKVMRGLELSPVHQVLIEECLFGWKEYELELLRDANENVIIVCTIENLDPMAVVIGMRVKVRIVDGNEERPAYPVFERLSGSQEDAP